MMIRSIFSFLTVSQSDLNGHLELISETVHELIIKKRP